MKNLPTWRGAIAKMGPAETPQAVPIERVDPLTLSARIGATPRKDRAPIAEETAASAPWRRALRTPPTS